MNRQSQAGITVLASLIFGVCLGVFAENKPGYDVKPSSIVPEWSGAAQGVWTMDYESALANAKTHNKWTVMLYSGMWWCPHCQPLESIVLESDEWKSFVWEHGFFLTVLDFPYRDGASNFCWLWDADYLANAGLTAEEGQREIEKRYMVQDSYAVPTAATASCPSLLEGGQVITYKRIGYPTMLLMRPDGSVAGRFSVNKANAAIPYVINRVQSLLNADEWDERDDYWQTATEINEPECEDTSISHGIHTLGITDTADWFKINVIDGAGKEWFFKINPVAGKAEAPLAAELYYGAVTNPPIATAEIDSGNAIVFSTNLGKVGEYWLKIKPASQLNGSIWYGLEYEYQLASATVKFSRPTVSATDNKDSVSIPIDISNTDKDVEVEIDWVAKDGTAKFGEDYGLQSGKVVWNSGETKRQKYFAIPLLKSDKWKGNRSFSIVLYPHKHCTVPEGISECVVTITETKARNAGRLVFEERFRKEIPQCLEGSNFTASVMRQNGADGVVTGIVSVTDGKLRNVVVTNLVWGHGESGEKIFTYELPREDGVQADRYGTISLKAANGGTLGTPNTIRYSRRDEMVVNTFDEYNKSVLGSRAKVSGDSWFYGLEVAGDESTACFRSDILTSSGTKLAIDLVGPGVLKVKVDCRNSAAAALSLGNKELGKINGDAVFVAIPSGRQRITLKAEAGDADGAYIIADWTFSSLSEFKFIPVLPHDKSAHSLANGLVLKSVAPEAVSLPETDTGIAVDTLVAYSTPNLKDLVSTCAYPEDGRYEVATQMGLLSAGKTLYWRMDVVYSDAFGNKARVLGNVATVRLVEEIAPRIDTTVPVPDSWMISADSIYMAPIFTVGVDVYTEPIVMAGTNDSEKTTVAVKNGSLPVGVNAVVDSDGVRLVGVPVKEGTFTADLFFTKSVKSGNRIISVPGASVKVTCVVEPLEDVSATYNGYRILYDDSSFNAGFGTASMTISKSGTINGKFMLDGSNFTFRASSFSARTNSVFYLNGTVAKCGKLSVPVSLTLSRILDDARLQHICCKVGNDGCTEYWLYRNEWDTKAGNELVSGKAGYYTAALSVEKSSTPYAPQGNGYLTFTVKNNGAVTYSGVDSMGKAFSGSTVLFYVPDCCNFSGYRWVFYVCAKPSGSIEPGPGIYGLVLIETADDNASRVVSTADGNALTQVNLSPSSVYGYTGWTNSMQIAGNVFDRSKTFEVGYMWESENKFEVLPDYDGRDGNSGYLAYSEPEILTITATTPKQAAFSQSDWNFKSFSPNFNNGIFSFLFSCCYSNGARTKVRAITAKGVWVQDPNGEGFWSGYYTVPEKALYIDDKGKEHPYTTNTSFPVLFLPVKDCSFTNSRKFFCPSSGRERDKSVLSVLSECAPSQSF
ncbi:MAG: hypothetical protein IJU44_12980 [Kiritimatiellae bacterium]|nr:hypothetical protein [Kiritimatiellia bacterium]